MTKAKKKFNEVHLYIICNPELSAGLRGFMHEVDIKVPYAHEDEMEEFISSIKEFFRDFYDANYVYTEEEYQKIIDQENSIPSIED